MGLLWKFGPLEVTLLPTASVGTEIAGVVRGLGLSVAGIDLSGEGMGIGGVVLRVSDVTFFPLSHVDELGESYASRTLKLNGLSRRYLGPIDVTELHRELREFMTPLYLRGVRSRAIFRLLMMARSLLLRTKYVPSLTRDVCKVTYRFDGELLSIEVKRQERTGRLIVANELSGRLFDRMLLGDESVELGPWSRCYSRTPSLASRKLGLTLRFHLPEGIEAYVGREVMLPRLDWAGVDLVLRDGEREIRYAVEILRS